MFIMHKNQTVETSKCPSTDEWINKMSYKHTMEYYLVIKRNETMIHATK